MAIFFEECKQWISYIQNLELKNIDVTISQNVDHNADSNKYLFKVLLHLSHCADKCFKENLPEESHIFRITQAICENLTIVPDKDKFFSALYFIIYYLLNRQCFLEAKIITKFLLPGKVLHINSQDFSKYHRLAKLWQEELFKKLETYKKIVIDDVFINFVNFHWTILKYCDEKYQYTFITADLYVRKLAKIPLEYAFPCLDNIFKHLSNYIQNLKKISIVEAYNMSIVVIALAFIHRSDIQSNPSVVNYFLQCYNYFSKSFATETQCKDCYHLFKMYCINLFESYFATKDGDMSFKNIRVILKDLVTKYGAKNNSLIQTVYVISYSFEPLFSHWENLVALQLKNTMLTYDDIVIMGSFVKCVHNILINREFQWNYTCKQCPESNKCLVKKDIYFTSIATAAYIKVFTRANQDTLNEKMFAIAKELLELIVTAFNELKTLDCKYSSKLWETCGRLIFNIGLISENKYAAQLEGLYNILCKQIVHHDGLKASISSFGLENPVGTSLHRLCNIYYHQEKYRQAMTYAAYNALLSVLESRKKKACDIWANIKLKTKDSKELKHLTMLECLKTDADTVKKLGIIVNLNDYDLNDLCLKELKSLYLIKNNLLDVMKQTINELESRNSITEYVQGTILLCFHALKINKREYISDYISKAMKKLKNFKQKPNSTMLVQNHCLLANLAFFKIVETLYVRSQVIIKEMEDANFTMKTFKTLKGNQANLDMESADEIIVPTYGGISIEEDNELASELNYVLTLWENCMLKDMSAVIATGELTLETIIICGEYCRLYKFSFIEEKSWKLAYKYATAIKDFATCTYVTSRSLSLRCISDNWLSDAKKYIKSIENSNKSADIDTMALFWLSLADFYLDCKEIEEAKTLLDKVKSIPNFNLVGNIKLYIYLVDIQFRNYFTINSKASQEDYCQLIVELHYLLINSYEMMSENNIRCWNIRYHFISCEQMFESLSSIVIPMNSLLSYRDVSLHLSLALKCAQKLGISVRIAEFLKYLCYIDLWRLQIDSCETHIQDLEHVLCLNNYKTSSRANQQQKTANKLDQKVRNVPISLPKNSASPELEKKMFTVPEFLKHTHLCRCFYCVNLHYQYLTFSYSHIQAQLFSLLKYTMEAECYFHGACKIKCKIDENDTDESRQYLNYQWKRPQKYTIDYMMYLLDFSMFIVEFKLDQKDDALDLIDETQKIAADNDLSNHSVTYHAIELYTQHYMYEDLHSKLNIFVPQDIKIDITNQQLDNCITPKVPIEKTICIPRRRKSPLIAALPTIVIPDEEDIENDSTVPNKSTPNSTTGSETEVTEKPKKTSARNVRRKLLTDESDESSVFEEKEKKEAKIVRKKSTRKVLTDELNGDFAILEKPKEETKVITKRSTKKLLVNELDGNIAIKIKEDPDVVSKRSYVKPFIDGLDETLEIKNEVKEKIESKRITRSNKKSTG